MVFALCMGSCALQHVSAMGLGRGAKAVIGIVKYVFFDACRRTKKIERVAELPNIHPETVQAQRDVMAAPDVTAQSGQSTLLQKVPSHQSISSLVGKPMGTQRKASIASSQSSHSTSADLDQREAALRVGIINVMAIQAMTAAPTSAVAAATKIQSLVRGYLVRKQLQRALQAHQAATSMQPDIGAGVGASERQRELQVNTPEPEVAPEVPAAHKSIFTTKNFVIAAGVAAVCYNWNAIQAWWNNGKAPKVDAVAQELINAQVAVKVTEEAQEAPVEVVSIKA